MKWVHCALSPRITFPFQIIVRTILNSRQLLPNRCCCDVQERSVGQSQLVRSFLYIFSSSNFSSPHVWQPVHIMWIRVVASEHRVRERRTKKITSKILLRSSNLVLQHSLKTHTHTKERRNKRKKVVVFERNCVCACIPGHTRCSPRLERRWRRRRLLVLN